MIVVPHNRGVMIGSSAALLDEATHLQAWAERHVRSDPDLRWVLGNYVEAEEANSNGHIFPLGELLRAQHTLPGKPLNMLHREHYIVGAFAGAQLLTADGVEINEAALDTQAIAASLTNVNTTYTTTSTSVGTVITAAVTSPPHVEALAGMWHQRFPEEFFNIKKAHADGSLFFSMEAIPESVSCPTCMATASFAGLTSNDYCEHMNGAVGPKILHNPTFCGGAIIIPPVKPGWHRADITAISKLIKDCADEAQAVYEAVAEETPHLDSGEWEVMMMQILQSHARGDLVAKNFSTDKRDKMAKKGTALPDGSYPIENAADLKNAIKAVGRAKDPSAAKAHIKKRAKALGLTNLIPPGW